MNQCGKLELQNSISKEFSLGVRKKLSVVEILQRVKSSVFALEGTPPKSNTAQTDELTQLIVQTSTRYKIDRIPTLEEVYQILYNNDIIQTDVEQEDKIKQVEGNYEEYFSKQGFLDLYKNAESVGIKAQSDFLHRIVELAIYNPNSSDLVITSGLLNSNLYEYQNELWKTVVDYLNKYHKNHGLNLDNIQDFPKLQTKIFKLLTNNWTLDGNTILHRSQSILATNKNFINAFNAFNLLVHFDILLSKTFSKNIDINSNLKNTYGINKNIAKYRFVAGNNLQSHWRTTDDPNVSKETANIVKILISSIPLYSSSNSLIPNAYLEFNQYTHIINQIRNLSKETRNLQIPNSIYKLYQNYLQNNNIQTLGNLIDHIRIGKPTLEYKILYEIILHLYNNGYNLYEKQYKHYIKGLNNVDISYIQSIYNYVFNTEKSLYSKFIDYTGENNFYEFIIQSMLTLSPTNFTQYKSRSSDDSTLVVKNMHLEASDKNAKFIENYLLTAYNPIMPNQIYWKNIKDRLSIQYDGEYIKFKIGNNFEVKYNPKLGNEPVVTGEFNENVFKELDIITNFGNIYEIFSNIHDNKSGITETIIRFYAPLISNIYFNNEYESILTDIEKFNIDGDNITPKSKKIKLDTAVNKFYSKDTKPVYLDKYNQYSIIPKKYYSNYTQLVRAYSILKGVTTKSTVSDSEGNQLGISNMSRVYEGIRTQIQQIKNSENSPLKNLAIVQSDLVEDYIVSRELYKGKKLIDMTPNESYFLSLVVDFLPRGTVNNDFSDRDDMYFYPYVIADKSVIMKTRISRTNLDEILRNLYKKSKAYKTWYQSLSQKDKDKNNFDFKFLNKVSKVDLIHNAIQLELGDVYEGVLTQVKTKWDKLIKFIQQKTLTSYTFDAIHDFSGFEEFLADVNKRSNNEHTPKQFLNYWISEYQKIDSNLVFRENIEYIFINGNLKTNRSIIAKVHRFRPESELLPKDLNIYTNYQFYTDYKEFVSDKEEKLLFDLLDNNFTIDTYLDNKYFGIKKFKNYKEWIGKDAKVILAKAVKGDEFIDIRKIKDFHKFKNELESQGYKLVIHPIIEEYNWTDYLISQETMYTHMGIPEINPDKAALKAYDVTLFHERNEESNRNTAQTKRNVTESAIMNLYTPGLEKGLPDVLNCACVEDMETPVFNYTGDTGAATIWDGSIWVDGAYWYLQNHSLGSSAAGPTQKSIWHYMDPETAAVTIVKSACPTIDNYACRNSVHWRNMIKKMRSSIKWDKPYNLSKKLSELNIYYKNEKGIYKKRDSFEFNINSLNEAEYTYTEYTVNENGDLLDKGTEETKIITDNWDLFELLGGINAVSLNLNGVLSQDPKHNDISNKQLADLMCTRINEEQPLKNLGISYLISRSAIKKGIGNTNLQSTYSNENALTYLQLKLGYFGIQLDKTHEAEGSHLNILSQVTNALASRGYTGLQASEMYQALKSVAEDAMTPFTNEYAEILGITHKGKIADLIAKKLAYQDSQGGGDILHSIVADLIKLSNEGIDLSTSNINLPVSLPATYKKLISVVSSTLSHLAIRLKFDGILAVLTPSHDIYKIFNGKQLKDFNSYEELIAEEEKANFISVYKLSPGTTYKRFINGQFAGFADITDPNKYWQEQAFFADQIGKGVKFTYKEALYSEEIYTNSEGKTERIITPIGRNLEPYNVFFSDGKTTFSMWDLVSVRKMWLASDIETKKKLRKEFQEDLLRIQNKESVEVNIYGLSGVTSVLVKPISVEVKPYENIMSNRLCKEFGVSPSTNINEITEDFFLEQLRTKFKTKVDNEDFDVEIKQYNGEHIYLIQQGSSTTFTNLRQDYNASTFIDSAGRIWLTDINGEKTHQLSSLNDKVYLNDKGNRIIYTNNLKFYSDLYSDNNQLISSKYTDESSVLDIDPVWNQMNESFKNKYEGRYDINFELLRNDFELLKEVTKGSYLYKKLERQAKQKYNSFQMSLNTLVARIPSQSMQSVMAMRTVGFDETGLNNVSVSIWQIWLQGSKLTIFK